MNDTTAIIPTIVEIEIEGITPLIMHRFSTMCWTPIQNPDGSYPTKPAHLQMAEAAYRLPDGSYGYPAVGFKAAMINAARFFIPSNGVA